MENILEIKDGYNTINIEIKNYIKKEKRIKDEDEYWCDFFISCKNEYLELNNSFYQLKCAELDDLYKILKNYIDDKITDNYIFEPLEPSFKIFLYPFGKEYKNNNYKQENFNFQDKVMTLFVAFIEKANNAISEDGITIDISEKDVVKIINYIEDNL